MWIVPGGGYRYHVSSRAGILQVFVRQGARESCPGRFMRWADSLWDAGWRVHKQFVGNRGGFPVEASGASDAYIQGWMVCGILKEKKAEWNEQVRQPKKFTAIGGRKLEA